MNRNGQVMIVAIVIMLVLAITLPALISYTQNESRWTLKEQRTTKSYQLAESAVEHGFQKLLISSSAYYSVQAGTPVSGFNFDTTYTGVTGGSYQVKFVAGPSASQITVLGVGKATTRDNTNDVRAIKVIYTNGSGADNAISAGKAVSLGASVNVEWGSVISYTSIDPGGRTHPRFYSAGAITGYDTSAAAPNSDNVLWWSYDTDLPTQPQIDLQYYKTLAQSYGSAPAGCPSYYYNPGSGVNTNVTGCIDNNNRTYYFETGDWTWKAPGENFVLGNIVLASGNMSISGNGGNGTTYGAYAATVPPQAWEEYGKDAASWAIYKCMDAYANTNYPTYQDAVDANYTASATHNIPSTCVNSAGGVLLHGFIYAGGGTGLSGGGNARFHGAVITPNTATASTSNFTIYFDNSVAANIHTIGLSLSRASWQELSSCSWSGANATCP